MIDRNIIDIRTRLAHINKPLEAISNSDINAIIYATSQINQLTIPQRRILPLLISGNLDDEISKKLDYSVTYVKKLITNIYADMNLGQVRNRKKILLLTYATWIFNAINE
ncbi:MAG: hypothetical protein GY797_28635 [Deltaproteobacteria bacterium]|nr:hypothetical protein [Deltaproteobacteria bacterium]